MVAVEPGRYEGVYTQQEVELNKLLYEECTRETLDRKKIVALLQKGADPLGATTVSGWGLLEHVYGEIICDLLDRDSANLPQITELFLENGMNLEKPRIPYDNENSIHPMRDLAFAANENGVQTLKLLLDIGISAEAAAEMWGHLTDDLLDVECGDPANDVFWNAECVWAMKIMMLCASYDHVVTQDENLRNLIGCGYNSYDLHRFRNWNDFAYRFDTSRCRGKPELYRSVVHIDEIASGQEVWKVGICLKEEEI